MTLPLRVGLALTATRRQCLAGRSRALDTHSASRFDHRFSVARAQKIDRLFVFESRLGVDEEIQHHPRALRSRRLAIARAKVARAIIRLEQGNFSNVKSVGSGVFEYRIDFGPGYRVYFGQDGPTLVILLTGGTKNRQQRGSGERR
jgi:putative addiction module killer protein